MAGEGCAGPARLNHEAREAQATHGSQTTVENRFNVR